MNWYQKYSQEITQEERNRINDEMINELTIEYRKKWTPIDSSFIHEVSYDEKSKIFKVKIRVGGTIRTYTFVNVPKDLYDAFIESSSKGTFFNSFIKRRYELVRTADRTSPIHNYLDVGHSSRNATVDIWYMTIDGDITSKTANDPWAETHLSLFGQVLLRGVIASGRFDHEAKECSLVLKNEEIAIEWIKNLLRAKFGSDIEIVSFIKPSQNVPIQPYTP